MKEDPPAFPRPMTLPTKASGNIGDPGADGMTLLQWYAGQAIAGFCANPQLTALHNLMIERKQMTPGFVREHLADAAWLMADEMIRGENRDDTEREGDRALRMGEVPGDDTDAGDGGGDGNPIPDTPDVGDGEEGGGPQDPDGPDAGGTPHGAGDVGS